jgi:hypothetical protein
MQLRYVRRCLRLSTWIHSSSFFTACWAVLLVLLLCAVVAWGLLWRCTLGSMLLQWWPGWHCMCDSRSDGRFQEHPTSAQKRVARAACVADFDTDDCDGNTVQPGMWKLANWLAQSQSTNEENVLL